MNLVCATFATANPKPDKDAQLAGKIKAGIAKLGTGPQAHVELKLRDGTRLKGYVSEVSDDHFVVIDWKTGASTTVPYPQVKQVKGNNLSTGAWVAIGIAAIVGITVLLLIALRGS
ncbi:MAG TPA: hypothetical protein VE863_07855 [Pyrinomonadaceae bacterium]|nr:hypothetical protein [Pyrinomonadaceae bacterium]